MNCFKAFSLIHSFSILLLECIILSKHLSSIFYASDLRFLLTLILIIKIILLVK